MSLKSKILSGESGWLVVISGLHAYLNVNWEAVLNDYRPLAKRKIIVAYIPVTCQLTCPVTDYISKFSASGEMFLPRMFQGFPEIKEALISNKVQAAFIVAPLAIALRAQGVPIKVVYLGPSLRQRRGGSKKNGPVKTFADMRGRTVAIPSRFSDERLLIFRAMKVWASSRRDQDGGDGPAGCFRRARGRSHRRLLHGRAVSLAGGNGAAMAAFSSKRANTGPTICRASWLCARI